MSIINIDGIRVQIKPPDLDGDGEIGGIEHIQQKFGDSGTQNIVQATELGESLRELNQDEVDIGTRMSGIDMRANLHPIEVSSILGLDTLVAMKFLPVSCMPFTRSKKRLSVSKLGRGREQIVEMVGGKKERDKMGGQSMWDKAKGMVGMGGK